MKKLISYLFITILLLTGCSNSYRNINAEEAKNQIEINQAILIDVRSELEYNQNHIEGSVNIPLDTIDESIKNTYTTNTPLIVYCQSGTRSKQAAEKLIELGYKDVFNLGSINNWK